MASLPSTRQLQYLATLDELKSFSRAAERCHVTQSTFSAGIATLENLLGRALVDRSRRQVALTPLGLEVAAQARRVLAEAQAIVDRVRYLGEPLAGPLRLGVIPTVAPYLLPDILPQLKIAYPRLELQLHEDLSGRLVEALETGGLDVVLMAFPYDHDGLAQTTLFGEDFVIAARPGDWTKPRPATPDMLDGERLMLLEEGHCLRDQALAACRLPPQAEARTFRAASLATLTEMVRGGYGLTLLPRMAVRHAPADLDLIPFTPPAPGREIGLAWRRGAPREEEFRLLARTLAEGHAAG